MDIAENALSQDLRNRLNRRFRRTSAAAGLDSDEFDRLDGLYGGPGRHYHGWRHIAECLEQFDRIAHLLRDPLAVELALWFHDAVYVPGGSRNEVDSAGLAFRSLATTDRELARKVQRFIEATDYARPATVVDPDLDYLMDIDFAPFGKPFEGFWEDVQRLDRENSRENHSTRRTRRLGFYRRILDGRIELFRTSEFRQRYLRQALDNVRRATALLESSDDRSP
jgi:predicted metal-dependent HD superfamily phosphohydrolase